MSPIGAMAGEILSTLERGRGRASLEQLTSARRCSRDLAMLALGYLLKAGLVSVQPGMGDWFIQARS